jgi:hypothetical protein
MNMAKQTQETALPHEALERIYHSPGRTAIMAAVCAAGKTGITFTDLKDACNLSDGALNAHLTALIGHAAVKMKKEIVGVRPRTTVSVTKAGLDGFAQYLDALQTMLKDAKAALSPSRKTSYVAGRAAEA